MMNGHGKSDKAIVPKKFSNEGERKEPEERMEGRALAEGNETRLTTHQTQSWTGVPQKLWLIHQRAKADRKMRFNALMHHIYNLETLRYAYFGLKRDAAAGVDGEDWKSYGENLEGNLRDLSQRLQSNAYRPKPVRRTYIPKTDGRQRPLGVTTLEDKIVQKATVLVLNAVYEADFVGFSYGFRPKRSQHNALAALQAGIMAKKVNWVLDADIRDFFSSINHEWMIKFIEHRIADKRVVRLIRKWLKAGVLENGEITYTETGTPQGGSASPQLANVYLHYVYDLWVQWWRKNRAAGDVIVVRFADDTIIGFQHKSDAVRFQRALQQRLKKFELELHPQKTRLIEFGRFADRSGMATGKGKPDAFTFLGFVHICDKTRGGKFTVTRHTEKKRLHAKVKELRRVLKLRMHEPVKKTGKWLSSVLAGHYRYYGVTNNMRALRQFYYQVCRAWNWALQRRSQRAKFPWERMRQLIESCLPTPRIYHSEHALDRFGVFT